MNVDRMRRANQSKIDEEWNNPQYNQMWVEFTRQISEALAKAMKTPLDRAVFYGQEREPLTWEGSD